MTKRITASAPGSVMVIGEHAVVYGAPAMVAAIDQRATVTVTARSDTKFAITSEIAPPALYDRSELRAEGPYRFVVSCLLAHLSALEGGLEIAIRSDINPTLGLGSSSAVTIACLAALAAWSGQGEDATHGTALQIVRSLQGRGSGADLAAALTGGLIGYQLSEDRLSATITRMPDPPVLSLRYAGYKTPTGDVLAMVAEAWADRDAALQALYADMGAAAARAIAATHARNWSGLAEEMSRYQMLMASLGVSDTTLDSMIAEATAQDEVLACKISGSGLGDCVLALGGQPAEFTAAPLADRGVILHAP